MAARLGVLLAGCLWGAMTGWAVALLAVRPEVLGGDAAPGLVLLLYGAAACFGAGYLAGSALRGRLPRAAAGRAAALTAALALTAKLAAPGLAPWTAVLIAAAVFGALAGLRTRP
jgi:FtsH-binding integral membrane protein